MILVDTSAWVEFLQNTGSAVCVRVDELLASEIAVCDALRMEEEGHLLTNCSIFFFNRALLAS